MALNVAACCVSVNSVPTGQRTYEPVGKMLETIYGSDDPWSLVYDYWAGAPELVWGVRQVMKSHDDMVS
jgi:hypothetical protein